jgi:hypothetical protein
MQGSLGLVRSPLLPRQLVEEEGDDGCDEGESTKELHHVEGEVEEDLGVGHELLRFLGYIEIYGISHPISRGAKSHPQHRYISGGSPNELRSSRRAVVARRSFISSCSKVVVSVSQIVQ